MNMRIFINGLSLLVQEAMELNPFDEAVVVLFNRPDEKIMISTLARIRFMF